MMKRFLPLILAFFKGFIVFYIFLKLIKIMFQPVSNIIAIVNSVIKKKVFSSKKEFIKEAGKDKYGLLSFLLYCILGFIGTLEAEIIPNTVKIFCLVGLIILFLFGVGIFFTPIPKSIRTDKYPKPTFSNYILPFIYYDSWILAISFIISQ